jgi:hypothetical protein
LVVNNRKVIEDKPAPASAAPKSLLIKSDPEPTEPLSS